MKRLAVIGIAAAFLAGCGGSGATLAGQDGNPNGAFRAVLDQRADGDVLDLELNVVGGNIQGTFARLTPVTGQVLTSTNISGSASDGNISADINFENFVFEFRATFADGAWSGTYRRMQGETELENGVLQVTKTGAVTVNMSGNWSGSYTITAGPDQGFQGTWAVTITQSGNSGSLTGNVDESSMTGSMTIVGNRVNFGTAVTGGGTVSWTGQATLTNVSGTWTHSNGNSGTFSGTKQ